MITSGQASVTTSRIRIDGTSANVYNLVLHNSGTNTIYLGNETVTANDGFNLHANTTLTLELPPLTALFAVASSGSHDLSWMRIEF